MLRYKTEWVKLLGGSSCIGFVLVLLLNLSHVAQLLHKSTVSVFLYWLWGLCSEILRWGRAAQLPPAWVLMVPVLPKDENWLSAATVRLVTFGPIRTPQEGAGAQGRAECSGCTCLSWFAMEEIYAKFVSQKISKTRWRPVPPGSLQTADTFAAGSWDNEVPPLLGEKLLLPPFSWNRAAGGPRASSRLLARLAISVPKFPS